MPALTETDSPHEGPFAIELIETLLIRVAKESDKVGWVKLLDSYWEQNKTIIEHTLHYRTYRILESRVHLAVLDVAATTGVVVHDTFDELSMPAWQRLNQRMNAAYVLVQEAKRQQGQDACSGMKRSCVKVIVFIVACAVISDIRSKLEEYRGSEDCMLTRKLLETFIEEQRNKADSVIECDESMRTIYNRALDRLKADLSALDRPPFAINGLRDALRTAVDLVKPCAEKFSATNPSFYSSRSDPTEGPTESPRSHPHQIPNDRSANDTLPELNGGLITAPKARAPLSPLPSADSKVSEIDENDHADQYEYSFMNEYDAVSSFTKRIQSTARAVHGTRCELDELNNNLKPPTVTIKSRVRTTPAAVDQGERGEKCNHRREPTALWSEQGNSFPFMDAPSASSTTFSELSSVLTSHAETPALDERYERCDQYPSLSTDSHTGANSVCLGGGFSPYDGAQEQNFVSSDDAVGKSSDAISKRVIEPNRVKTQSTTPPMFLHEASMVEIREAYSTESTDSFNEARRQAGETSLTTGFSHRHVPPRTPTTRNCKRSSASKPWWKDFYGDSDVSRIGSPRPTPDFSTYEVGQFL